MKGKNMVKDKKKASDPTAGKSVSDYQAGKKSASKLDSAPNSKNK
jgi:hypothetical protein